MTKPSTTSKPSTGSDISTKKTDPKNRWFRATVRKPDLPELDQIFDAYWGGPERRITGLTVRIIAVNAIALVMLILGTLYLSQYQTNLIEAKLETFKARVDLVSAAITESATEDYRPPRLSSREPQTIEKRLSVSEARRMVRTLSLTMDQRILLFDNEGGLIIDSSKITSPDGTIQIAALPEPDNTLYSIQILKRMARLVLKIIPDRQILPIYHEIDSNSAQDYPDVPTALSGETSFSAWNDEDDHIFLSAADPLMVGDTLLGAVLLTREAQDIEKDIGEVWLNIIKTFIATSIVTIMLSIYLSGVIARPLKKLAWAAEGVRKGKLSYDDIPDMSARYDEIGELSMALRQMTAALGDRMDTIERFAADVAHELKNPLTSLRSAIETAAVVKKKSDRDKLMKIIMHDVERLDRLISDISNASRLDAELSREELQRVDLKSVLNNLLDAYKGPLARDKNAAKGMENKVKVDGVQIDLKFDSDKNVYVWGLEGRIEQVFQNLLSNALSFSSKKSAVTIFVSIHRKRATITIEDEGPGIPPNKLETIFERFYSQRPEHEDYGKHSGLGLSICRQIVDALGGKLFAENISDKNGKTAGARFTVVLNMV